MNKNKKSNSTFTLPLFIVFFLLTSCQSTEAVKDDISVAVTPEWMMIMPQEENQFYGIGSGEDSIVAKQMAVIDIGQQFNTKVQSTMEDRTIDLGNGVESIVNKIESQTTDQIIHGTKFVDQFTDGKGTYWILAKTPLSCMLDITEGLLLSYSIELNQEDVIIEELIRDITEEVKKNVTKRIPWNPRVSDKFIKIDGKLDDWESVPIYYIGRQGDTEKSGFDLEYIKRAKDSERAYFLLVCANGNWSQYANFEINFDYDDFNATGKDYGNWSYQDLHTNINREWANFWASDANVETTPAYDPDVIKRFRNNVFEFSIPLDRYEANWFNILYCNIWDQSNGNNEMLDSNEINYRSTWTAEYLVPRY